MLPVGVSVCDVLYEESRKCDIGHECMVGIKGNDITFAYTIV
jgi:hypothetical protein